MKSLEQERLEIKLRLWETPGFEWFLRDLEEYSGGIISVEDRVKIIKRIYQERLKEISQAESKFKQGNLGL